MCPLIVSQMPIQLELSIEPNRRRRRGHRSRDSDDSDLLRRAQAMRAKQQEKEQRHRVSVVKRGYYSSDSSVREGVGGRGRYTFRPISKVKVYQPVRARREIMNTMNGNLDDPKDIRSQEDYPTTSTRNSRGERLRKQRSRCSESVDADLEFSQIVQQMVAADSAKKKKSDRSKRRKSIPIPVQKPHGVSSWTSSRISVKEIDTIRETIRREVLNDLRHERASLLEERRQVETLRQQLKGRRKLIAPPAVRSSPSTQLVKTRSAPRPCLPPSPLAAGAGPLKAYTSRSPPREASCEWGLLQDDLMSSLSSIAGCL
ncbi:MAG: hypothetical protein KVP17_000212 [Porospora cf. gigantea B]|nr:MAG: hypothetical protein KVP17_000212 [Porospora cf. gigantea B]